jgi:hypothetical protein
VFGNAKMRAAASAEGDESVHKHHDELLRTTLPVKLRSRLEVLYKDLRPHEVDHERFLAAADRAADRAGMLVCGSAKVAFEHAGHMSSDGRRHTRHLVQMALGPDYLAARKKLGIGSKS